MRIIKPGIIDGDKIEQVTCGHCKCEFEFMRREAQLVYDQRDGDFFKIACPACGKEVTKDKR